MVNFVKRRVQFPPLWKYSIPGIEITSIPIPAYKEV